jgi:hypothetical protein
MTNVKELLIYRLDLVGVQELRWDRGYTEPAGKGNENHEFGTGAQKNNISS